MLTLSRTIKLSVTNATPALRNMGKNKKRTDVVSSEEHLLLPSHPAYSVDATAATAPGVIDTHTHIAATFAKYRSKYKQGKYKDAYEFFRAMCGSHKIDAVVDVWCEAPVSKKWREFADSALTIEDRVRKWGGTEYWFVMGKSPSLSVVGT
jgi:TatD DNase family protein